jgi:hypothetical protein
MQAKSREPFRSAPRSYADSILTRNSDFICLVTGVTVTFYLTPFYQRTLYIYQVPKKSDPWADRRVSIDMMSHGRSTSLFQLKRQ